MLRPHALGGVGDRGCVGSTESTRWSLPDRLLLVGLSSSSRTRLVGWFESRSQGVRKLSLAPCPLHTLSTCLLITSQALLLGATLALVTGEDHDHFSVLD